MYLKMRKAECWSENDRQMANRLTNVPSRSLLSVRGMKGRVSSIKKGLRHKKFENIVYSNLISMLPIAFQLHIHWL